MLTRRASTWMDDQRKDYINPLLRSVRILRIVLEIWGDLLLLKLQWETIGYAGVKNSKRSYNDNNDNNNNNNNNNSAKFQDTGLKTNTRKVGTKIEREGKLLTIWSSWTLTKLKLNGKGLWVVVFCLCVCVRGLLFMYSHHSCSWSHLCQVRRS